MAAVDTPWGEPSDELLFGRLDGRAVRLPAPPRPRPRDPAAAINSRANIDALKRCGVTDVISLSAVGSLREELPPGHFVVVDQFIDRTFARETSFFGAGCVAHVSMATRSARGSATRSRRPPRALGAAGDPRRHLRRDGGPAVLDAAESELYRSWGCDVIGMTNMPEAKLAREAELATRPSPWSPTTTAGTPTTTRSPWTRWSVLLGNADRARALVTAVVPRARRAARPVPAGCDRALDIRHDHRAREARPGADGEARRRRRPRPGLTHRKR